VTLVALLLPPSLKKYPIPRRAKAVLMTVRAFHPDECLVQRERGDGTRHPEHELLRGPRGIMISNVVVSLFGAAYNWPLGAAISFCMLALVVGLLWLSEKLERRWAFS
jgi:hypothetical protein